MKVIIALLYLVYGILFVLLTFYLLDTHNILSYGVVSNTGSMTPYFQGGEVVLINNNFKVKNVNDGDILVFSFENRSIIHRVIDIKENEDGFWFLLKGDSNEVDDGFIHESSVLGKYLFKLFN